MAEAASDTKTRAAFFAAGLLLTATIGPWLAFGFVLLQHVEWTQSALVPPVLNQRNTAYSTQGSIVCLFLEIVLLRSYSSALVLIVIGFYVYRMHTATKSK